MKKAFINWSKDLDEQATKANENIQQLFYYNLFCFCALVQDDKTTIPDVRKHYAVDKFEKLYEPGLLDNSLYDISGWINLICYQKRM